MRGEEFPPGIGSILNLSLYILEVQIISNFIEKNRVIDWFSNVQSTENILEYELFLT